MSGQQMTPERYQQIKAIVQKALDLRPADQAAFLETACAGDAELRKEVDSLLAHDVSASDFLETPAAVEPQLALNPGDQLGPYQILAPLGSGGMGEVYRALDPRLGREVAIKVLPAIFAGDQDRLRRFELEARAASAVSHSNILVVHDIGMHQGSPFIVSELLEGTTLRTRLDAGEILERDAIQIAIGIAHGLAAAHQKGIVHRDLKPENLFVTGKNVVKILDFGLAKLVPRPLMEDADTASVSEDGTASGMVLGSVGYMSPEQVRGQPSDTRSDIFAFGAVLFEMLAGRRAFREGSKIETLHAILTRDPVAAETRREISEPVKRIVSRCLNKDPDQRFQSAQDLAFHLEELSVPSPPTQIVAGPQTLKPKPVARIVSGGWFPLVALLVVVAAVAVAGYVLWPRATPPAAILSASEITLAVLPFEILNPDPAQAHIVDGIKTGLINNLSRYEKVRIIDLATRIVEGRDATIRGLLAADSSPKITLRCTIVSLGEQIRIRAALVNTATNSSFWSREFEGHSGVPALVSNLADAIAAQLGVANTKKGIGQNWQTNEEALDLYFRGREALKWRTEKELVEAIRYFHNATKVDPRYALAHSGLADAYALLGGIGIDGLPPERARSFATEAARKALLYDPNLADAYISRAYVKLSYDWDLPGAKEDFQRGIALEPKSATAHHWYSHYYMAAGDLEKAMAEMKTALDYEPLSPSINNGLGWCFYYMRNYEKAIEQFQYALKLDPDFSLTHQTLGMAYQQMNRLEEAIAEFAQAERLSPNSPAPIAALACAYAATGRTAEARKDLARMEEMKKRGRYVPALYFLSIHLAFNDMKKVIDYGNQAIDERTDYLIYLGVEPRADSFRDSPELRKLQTLIKR